MLTYIPAANFSDPDPDYPFAIIHKDSYGNFGSIDVCTYATDGECLDDFFDWRRNPMVTDLEIYERGRLVYREWDDPHLGPVSSGPWSAFHEPSDYAPTDTFSLVPVDLSDPDAPKPALDEFPF